MTQKTASIIIPCYNVEKYLPRCLDSLLAQTLGGLEIICINDGSPDNCINILRDYEAKNPETIVVIDKENQGVWRGRMDAIAIAKGEYIGFVDSDDYVEPDFAERLYTAAKENDADISVGGFRRVDVDTGKTLSVEMDKDVAPFRISQEPQRLLELNGAPWNKFFRAEILKSIKGLEKPPRILDDMMLQLLIFLMAENIAFTPHVLVNYIIRNDSIITTIDETKLDSAYDAMLEVKEIYREDANENLLYFLDAAAFVHLGISMMFRVSYDKAANLKDQLRRNRRYLDEHFPTWNSDEIISSRNARKYKGALRKSYYGRIIYNSGLMAPALRVYRAMISRGHDIKW